MGTSAFVCYKDVKDDQKNKLLLVAGDFIFIFIWEETTRYCLGAEATGGMALPLGSSLLVFALKLVFKHGSFCLNECPLP